MRINDKDKQMELESRDINYILPAYLRSYLFYTKNQMPERIIFPMFPSVRIENTDIPIEYLPHIDSVVAEIVANGSNVAEVTEQQEAELDARDEEIKRLKAELEELQSTISIERGGEVGLGSVAVEQVSSAKPKSTSKAKAAFATPKPPARQPKLPPGGDIGTGQPLSDMHPRDRRDQVQTRKDLTDEPDINEAEEKEFGKEIARDKQGRPIVSG